ncbi:unnamed protein product, partial [marine sediment metagenome]
AVTVAIRMTSKEENLSTNLPLKNEPIIPPVAANM